MREREREREKNIAYIIHNLNLYIIIHTFLGFLFL